MPLLFNHEHGNAIGRIEDVRLREDGKLAGRLRFGRSARAQEVRQDVIDGVLADMSIGYEVTEWNETKSVDSDVIEYRATRWTLYEGSIVAVPADHTVGTGRSADRDAPSLTHIARHDAPTGEEDTMAGTTSAPAAPAGRTGSDEGAMPRQQEEAMIRLAATTFGVEREAMGWLNAGLSLDQVRGEIEKVLTARNAEQPPMGHVDLTAREERRYNPSRAILALAEGTFGRDGGLEREVSNEIAQRMGKASSGFFMPLNIRASVTGQMATTSSLGGAAVPTIQMSLIEILRNKLILRRAGARFLGGLTGNLKFPRQITATSPTWVGENPASGTALGAMTFDTVDMTPKTLHSPGAFSRQSLVQVSPDMQDLVVTDLVAGIALAIDSAGINGAGSNNQPTGVRSAGITNYTLGANGAALDWAKLVAFETGVATANADTGSLAWVTNPKVRGALKNTLKNTVNGSLYLWGGANDPGEINGYPAHVSNVIPANLTQGTSTTICSSIVFGNWAELLIGEWGGAVEVLVDPYTYASQGMIATHTYAMVDVGVRHVASFAKSDAVLTG